MFKDELSLGVKAANHMNAKSIHGYTYRYGVGIFKYSLSDLMDHICKQIVSNHKMGGQESSIQLIVPLTLYALYDAQKSFISFFVNKSFISIIKKYINLTKGHDSLHRIFLSKIYIFY